MSIARQNTLRIEDYALIGDCKTAALVGRDGSIDWLCWPRFDSGACLCALVGDASNGRFHIAPVVDGKAVGFATSRSYAGPTMILETVWETATGTVALIDFMVPETDFGTLIRMVECRAGTVDMRMELCLRFDYGQSVPWVTQREGGNGIVAISGPDMVVLRTDVDLRGEDMITVADFTVRAGERVPFALTHCASHLDVPMGLDSIDALYKTKMFWTEWSKRCSYHGEWAPAISRSLLTLKCLTDRVTGGIVAAPTTSLPEEIGGVRNWDYRFCWLRDASLTLFAFMEAGYFDEAESWSEWLQRSAAGSPAQVQIMYGIAGERRLDEWEVQGLSGYEGSKPVHIGNAASKQLQIDVYGEVCSALNRARRGNLLSESFAWPLQCELLAHLETLWCKPDSGLWETRGGEKNFTFSKVMAWVAYSRSIEDAENNRLEAPLDRWRQIRDEIFHTVCEQGFNEELNSFIQVFGETQLDASLLLIPVVGFLPGDDPRVVGTIAAIEKGLVEDGFVLRYRPSKQADGLPGREGAFLACSFWLAQAKFLAGQQDEARKLFLRLLDICNDVGLLSEEYNPHEKRFTGNFPQAFSHVALVTTALLLDGVRQ
ncbi:MAG: glycoside hydrolase family 15 protein [Acetobacteraceae bacterium]|nr:glycoside hydrolase family 15 protein [Acetobacteraceae bacterium]